MSETTGQSSGTIHATLQLGVSDTVLSSVVQEPLPIDRSLIVVDETSMVDQVVAAALIRSLKGSPSGRQHLVLVGDPEQLPPVGYGNFLTDIIASGVIPVCSLKTIYRQAAGNPIITNAARIREGRTLLDWSDRSFRRYHHGADEENKKAVCTFYRRCVKQFGIKDVILLSPFRRKGDICTNAINRDLQEALNPAQGQSRVKYGALEFRENDRVMQLRNTSTVSNGDVGSITKIYPSAEPEEICMTVLFDSGQEQSYVRDDLDQLDLAYAISVHKSQGSQYPCVLMILPNTTNLFIRRNLFYTGITRASKHVAIFSPTNTISFAIGNNKQDLRYTALKQRLQDCLASPKKEEAA